MRTLIQSLAISAAFSSVAFAASGDELAAPIRVEIAPGRSLSMTCLGHGKQTVLFDAGGSDWSVIWSGLAPRLADHARVCAYDRAGLGESDPARGPRTPFAIVEDMHALIEKAGLKEALVLVGHSLGGFNVKLYTALYPEDVTGLVLIDPAEERSWDRTRDWAVSRHGADIAARSELADRQFIARLVEHYRDCARSASPDGLGPATAAYRKCADPDRPQLKPATNEIRKRIQATSVYQSAQSSEIEWCVYADAQSDNAYARLFTEAVFGEKPLVVLTHEEDPSTDPVERLSSEQGKELHRQTASLSSNGVHRVISGSGHYIQLDKPEEVAAAIQHVLDAPAKRHQRK